MAYTKISFGDSIGLAIAFAYALMEPSFFGKSLWDEATNRGKFRKIRKRLQGELWLIQHYVASSLQDGGRVGKTRDVTIRLKGHYTKYVEVLVLTLEESGNAQWRVTSIALEQSSCGKRIALSF
jgi:hypothetical protein